MLAKFAKTTALSLLLGLGISSTPAAAQVLSCARVSDPDGWVNVRERYSRNVMGRIDNGVHVVYDEQTSDGYALLAGFPLVVHSSRLVPTRATNCRNYSLVRDPDGWSNVRATPGGGVVGRADSGEQVLRIGRSGDWIEVMTAGGLFGYIHTSRLSSPSIRR